MLTRRGLFGFAAGGAVAAPTLLMGERVSASPIVTGEYGAELVGLAQKSVVTIQVDGTISSEKLQRIIQRQMREALAEYDANRVRFRSQKG